jgi:hypothetical protein
MSRVQILSLTPRETQVSDPARSNGRVAALVSSGTADLGAID